MTKNFNKIKVCALGALYHGDNPEYLQKCLASISNQTVMVPIYIVIDGPISDLLNSKLKNFKKLNINYLTLEKNSGLAKALSHAISYLADKFEYVIRFDSDDINMPDRFEKLQNYIYKNKPDLVSSHMYEIDENDRVFSERKVPIYSDDIRRKIPYRNPINHPASAFKITSVQASGGYKEMPFFEDWYLWIRMLNSGFIIENMDEFLVAFRATDDMVLRRYGTAYVKNELNFFLCRSREKLISPLHNWIALILRLSSKIFGFSAYKKIFYLIRK